MKKLILSILILASLLGAFFFGRSIGYRQYQYSSANASLYSHLVVYDMIHKNRIEQAEGLLEQVIYNDCYGLNLDGKFDESIKNTPMGNVLNDVMKKAQGIKDPQGPPANEPSAIPPSPR